MNAVIILAGGKGERMNLGYNKLLYKINDKTIYEKTLEAFKNFKIYFVSDDIFPENVIQIKAGKTRFESVLNAINMVSEDYILIHDCARCFISKDIIDNCFNHELFYVGVKSKDTIRIGNDTPNRDNCYIVQTPQGGKTSLFKDAYNKAYKENKTDFTDDVSVVLNYYNMTPTIVAGSYENIKITTNSDIALYQRYRIGHSFDIHKLVENRKLILGGVNIPFEKGLLGHSDADVLYHSIAEAILGALALGDLGKLFPDNDPNTLGLDSSIIMKKCFELMDEKGYEINNIDSMIYAEKPKMASYINQMRENIAKLLHTDINNISVKATTYEAIGEIGACLAIASETTLTIRKK